MFVCQTNHFDETVTGQMWAEYTGVQVNAPLNDFKNWGLDNLRAS